MKNIIIYSMILSSGYQNTTTNQNPQNSQNVIDIRHIRHTRKFWHAVCNYIAFILISLMLFILNANTLSNYAQKTIVSSFNDEQVDNSSFSTCANSSLTWPFCGNLDPNAQILMYITTPMNTNISQINQAIFVPSTVITTTSTLTTTTKYVNTINSISIILGFVPVFLSVLTVMFNEEKYNTKTWGKILFYICVIITGSFGITYIAGINNQFLVNSLGGNETSLEVIYGISLLIISISQMAFHYFWKKDI